MLPKKISKVFKFGVIITLVASLISGILVYFFKDVYKKISTINISLKEIKESMLKLSQPTSNITNIGTHNTANEDTHHENNQPVKDPSIYFKVQNDEKNDINEIKHTSNISDLSHDNLEKHNQIDSIKDEISILKRDISNIEDLISNSDLSNSEIQDVVIESASNLMVNSEEKIKNNNNDSEFEHLDIVEIDNNSEFNELKQTIAANTHFESIQIKPTVQMEMYDNYNKIQIENTISENNNLNQETFEEKYIVTEINNIISDAKMQSKNENESVSVELDPTLSGIDIPEKISLIEDTNSIGKDSENNEDNEIILKENISVGNELIIENDNIDVTDDLYVNNDVSDIIQDENINSLENKDMNEESDIDSQIIQNKENNSQENLLSQEEIISIKSEINDKLLEKDSLNNTSDLVSSLSNKISNRYSKKQLENFCLEMNINKNGNKKDLINRLDKNGFNFPNIQNETLS